MPEALNKWNEKPDQTTLAYHLKQWDEPYRQTVAFADFISDHIKPGGEYVDAGCGAGSATVYLARRFLESRFEGIDSSDVLISKAIETSGGLNFDIDNLESLRIRFGVDGVTLIQVLHTLPSYHVALHQISTRIKPKWIAFSTLIYEGDIDCQIVAHEHSRPRSSYHNIYALPRLMAFLLAERYVLKKFQRFNLDIEIERSPNLDVMGTWTDRGLQRSGPLLLPWHFLMFERVQ